MLSQDTFTLLDYEECNKVLYFILGERVSKKNKNQNKKKKFFNAYLLVLFLLHFYFNFMVDLVHAHRNI